MTAARRARSSCGLRHPSSSTVLTASSRDEFSSLFLRPPAQPPLSAASASSALGHSSRTLRRKGPRLVDRLLRWPPQLVAVTPSSDEDEDETERRESYALDEVDSFKVVPKAKNVNHHKRVSL